YSVENGVFGTEARLDDILIDGTSLPGFDPDLFTYEVEVPGGVLIPQVTGLPIDPNATVIVVDATAIPGTTTIDVFAEDLTTHNVYNINWIFAVGDDEVKKNAVRAYPNPTTGLVYIQGALHARIAVYNAAGIEVKSIEDFTGNSINLSDLSEGVYMLSVQTQKGNLIQKKIALIK
ncbi:MAG: T9SS type A sorting domain-containing protein, partial [bacterium]